TDLFVAPGSAINARDSLALTAGGAITGALNLAAPGGNGQGGTIRLSAGQSLNLANATLTAGQAITVATAGGLVLGRGSLQSACGQPLQDVTLRAGGQLTVGSGSITALDRVELDAGAGLSGNLNLAAVGPQGTVAVTAGQSLNLAGVTLQARKQIAVHS